MVSRDALYRARGKTRLIGDLAADDTKASDEGQRR